MDKVEHATAHHKYRFVYREFYDLPRLLSIDLGESLLSLESHFDETVDDYTDYYTVRITRTRPFPESVNWSTDEPLLWTNLGKLAIKDVSFDPTRRKFLISPRLDIMLSGMTS